MVATNAVTSVISLDVGAARIGVAVARLDVRIAKPLTTIALEQTPDIHDAIATIVSQQQAGEIVVGWPRGLDGQTTGQTRQAELFADKLHQALNLPVHLQDEALTSQKAEAELQSRGKSYQKGDIDALAATYILEDYLDGVHHV